MPGETVCISVDEGMIGFSLQSMYRISWEGMCVSVLRDGLETDVNLTLTTVPLLHVRMVEHVL